MHGNLFKGQTDVNSAVQTKRIKYAVPNTKLIASTQRNDFREGTYLEYCVLDTNAGKQLP
jgi:hypothetical protein